MNKAHLIEAVAEKLSERNLADLPSSGSVSTDILNRNAIRISDRKLATLAVEAVFDTLVRAVVDDQFVNITGFGTLKTVARKGRYARNPQTGEPVWVPTTVVPSFRPGASFKALVAGTKPLVEGVSAVKKAPKTPRKK